MIVDVFKRRLVDASQTVELLSQSIVCEVEGRHQCHGLNPVGAAQADGFTATQVFHLAAHAFQQSAVAAQTSEVFGLEPVDGFSQSQGI